MENSELITFTDLKKDNAGTEANAQEKDKKSEDNDLGELSKK